jgi:hypothetical protein
MIRARFRVSNRRPEHKDIQFGSVIYLSLFLFEVLACQKQVQV